MANFIKYTLAVLLSLQLCGCNNEQKMYIITKSLIGRKLNTDWQKQYIPNRNYEVIDKSDLSIVVYASDQLCDSCFISYIAACKEYMNSYNMYDLNYLIISSRPLNELEKAMLLSKDSETVTIIHDCDKMFLEKNHIEKYTDPYRAFLVNQNKKILLIGDPVRNNNVANLYDKHIREYFNN